MGKQWYVIHTYAGHENKVKSNLEKAIHSAGLEEKFGQILVATEDFAEMRDGKRTISRRKTFPSYVMVEMDMDADTRNVVQTVQPKTVHPLLIWAELLEEGNDRASEAAAEIALHLLEGDEDA